jgi:tetratricopeptide (TPR) repeat protein
VARLLDRARRSLANNRRVETTRLCPRVWDSKPDSVDILCQLGTLYRQLGNPEAALNCYQRADARLPDVPAVEAGLAGALHALGRSRDALIRYDRALTLQPDDANELNNPALVLQAVERTRTRYGTMTVR